MGELVGHDGGHVFAAVRGNEVGSAGVVGKELGDIVDSVVECHQTPAGIREIFRGDDGERRHCWSCWGSMKRNGRC